MNIVSYPVAIRVPEYDPDNQAIVLPVISERAGRSLGFNDNGEISVLDERVSVTGFGAVGDGVTDDTAAIQAAVTRCNDEGRDLYWPNESNIYVTTASIRNFHNVKHVGAGVIKRGSDLWYISPKDSTTTNTIYCDSSVSTDGDGLSAATAIKEIRTATDFLNNYRHVISNGTWRIVPAPGQYKGDIVIPSGLVTNQYITILGSNSVELDISLNRTSFVGTFAIGNTVTGGTSGAIGTVSKVILATYGTSVGAQIAIVVTVVSGVFSAGETVSNGLGASAVANATRSIPAVVIDKDLDVSATRGILATDNLKLWIENIKFVGGFSQAESVSRNCTYQRRNVHVYGCAVGLDIDNRSTYFLYEGIIENCTSYGISELFGVVRGFGRTDIAGKECLIRDCDLGFLAKETCSGHLDDLRIEDCGTGLIFHAWTTANARRLRLRRCSTGVALVNSEFHNDTSVDYGTGADATTVKMLPVGHSSSINDFGWSLSDGNVTIRTGYAPPVLMSGNYTSTTLTGTTTETTVFSTSTILVAGRYTVKGRKIRVNVKGNVNGTTLGTITINLRMGTLLTQLIAPIGTAAQSFCADFEILCLRDWSLSGVVGANDDIFLCSGTLFGDTMQDVQHAMRTTDMYTTNRSVQVGVTLSNAADSVTIYTREVFA